MTYIRDLADNPKCNKKEDGWYCEATWESSGMPGVYKLPPPSYDYECQSNDDIYLFWNVAVSATTIRYWDGDVSTGSRTTSVDNVVLEKLGRINNRPTIKVSWDESATGTAPYSANVDHEEYGAQLNTSNTQPINLRGTYRWLICDTPDGGRIIVPAFYNYFSDVTITPISCYDLKRFEENCLFRSLYEIEYPGGNKTIEDYTSDIYGTWVNGEWYKNNRPPISSSDNKTPKRWKTQNYLGRYSADTTWDCIKENQQAVSNKRVTKTLSYLPIPEDAIPPIKLVSCSFYLCGCGENEIKCSKGNNQYCCVDCCEVAREVKQKLER